LLDEQRANELRAAKLRQLAEAEAVERDQQFRAQLPKGLSWLDVPDGSTAADVWRAAELSKLPRRRSMLEEALEADTLTFHPICNEEAS
jgi:hypothetical protein